jgi:hypothetical protein
MSHFRHEAGGAAPAASKDRTLPRGSDLRAGGGLDERQLSTGFHGLGVVEIESEFASHALAVGR